MVNPACQSARAKLFSKRICQEIRMPCLRALLIAAALIAALWSAACGVQLGKYASTGSFFDPLEPDFGVISVDRGTPALSSQDTNQNLIAVVLWCPGVKTRPPSGSSQMNGPFVTTR